MRAPAFGERSRGSPARHAGRPLSPAARRHPPTRGVLLALLATVVVVRGPMAAVMVGALVLVGWVTVRRRGEMRRRRVRDAAVPDLVDLFALAASAGLPVATALPVVAERAPLALRAPMLAAAGRMARGGTSAASFDQLRTALGPAAAPLLDAIEAAHRSGAPLRPALVAVAVAAHEQRARTAEEAARRLPVTLLFPLACCTLPAAVLLALVPVLVASLGSLAG